MRLERPHIGRIVVSAELILASVGLLMLAFSSPAYAKSAVVGQPLEGWS